MEKGLILVGAGPGDPELLTLKGLKAIEKADVILYDALVSKEILQFASSRCKTIFVGKRAKAHSMAQSAINSLILKYASHKLVVRLKGGDPFVFGRGYEEMLIAIENDIEVKVIPGITSAISGPASAGIPVSIRDVNRSFWVVTGTTSEGELNTDLELACRSSATIIVLMGMQKLEKITTLVRSFRGCSEPMAIIQNATLEHQFVTFGNAATIFEKHQENASNGPGIIVIGKAVERSLNTQALAQKIQDRTKAA